MKDLDSKESKWEKWLISMFVGHLRSLDYPCSQVDKWPDEDNRNSPDIDAIAGQVAIEHTRLDTIDEQSRDGEWFKQVVAELEDELKDEFDFTLKISIDYEEFSKAIAGKRKKRKVKDKLKEAMRGFIFRA